MTDTILKSIRDYKYQAISQMRASKEVMGLILNNPDINMSSEETFLAQENSFIDHNFCDDTFQSDKVVIFVEGAMVRRPSDRFMMGELYIQIVCNKDYISLNTDVFKGVLGNRNDNLASLISGILDLNTDDAYGVGNLVLVECSPKQVPSGFSSLMLVFQTEENCYDTIPNT